MIRHARAIETHLLKLLAVAEESDGDAGAATAEGRAAVGFARSRAVPARRSDVGSSNVLP